jgi:periplasmic copper chaperone A
MRGIVLLLTFLVIGTPALTEPVRAQAIVVDHLWSRPAAAGTNGAGFMTVSNRGKRADVLISVQSTAAARVEVHQTTMTNDVMSMKHLTTGLPLGPGQTVTFAPGGYHLMFVHLAKPSKVGDKIPAELIFRSGARLKVTFPVVMTPASGPTGHH